MFVQHGVLLSDNREECHFVSRHKSAEMESLEELKLPFSARYVRLGADQGSGEPNMYGLKKDRVCQDITEHATR